MNLPARPATLTPTALNRLVRQLLDDAMPPVWVEGELSNVARPASGHVYFTIKDAGAQIRCAMFRPRAQSLRFRPADGMHVRLYGRVGLYEPRGEFQLIAEQMEEAGEGALQRAFETLKQKLAAEGIFDSDRKRVLPAFPGRLAVITSPTGAAIRDVLTVIARRFPLLPVDVLPSPVQGAEAVPVLREQLRAGIASGRYDIILLTRGGGSLEDLWAFNDEQLARDVADSPIPIVAAIGHEIDVTLAELAADLRAPTPSAAAEAIAPDGAALVRQLNQRGRRLRLDMQQVLQRLSQRLDSHRIRIDRQDPRRRLQSMQERATTMNTRLRQAMRQRVGALQAGLDRLAGKLTAHNPDRAIRMHQERLRTMHMRLIRSEQQRRLQQRMRLDEAARALHALSPLRTLDRGYAILKDATTQRPLVTVEEVRHSGRVTARMQDGEILLNVDREKGAET